MSGLRRLIKRRWLWVTFLFLAIPALLFVVLPSKGHIPVLMYHLILPESRVGATGSLNVSVSDFERQMWFLKTFGFRSISLDEFYAIKSGEAKAHGKEVLISFDDGNKSYAEFALPILERYQIKSANFLIWDHLLRRWQDDLSLEDAKHLVNHPLITFGSHTLSHPNLSEISQNQARAEIIKSKENLEKALGRNIYYFSYPSGFFNQEIVKLVEEAGYRLAFTTARKRLMGEPETFYSMTRIKVGPRTHLFIFWLYVSGLMDYAKQVDHFFQRFLHRLTAPVSSGKLNVYEPGYKTT